MTRLSTLYGAATSIRRDRPLTLDNLMRVVPGVFGDDAHLARCVIRVYPDHHGAGKPATRGASSRFACRARVLLDRRGTQNTCCACVALGKITQRRCGNRVA